MFDAEILGVQLPAFVPLVASLLGCAWLVMRRSGR